MPTHVSFECFRDKKANLFFVGLAIPDVFSIHTGRVRYLPSNDKIVVLRLVRRESQQWSRVLASRALTNLESSLWWSYQMCLVFIPDVSGMDDQRPTASFQNALRVRSSNVSREFRRSEVPACVGNSDTSQTSIQLLSFQIC